MNRPQTNETLYRYFALDQDKHKDRITSLLLSNQIYFSNPTKFNDPFDRPHLVMGKPSNEIENQIVELTDKFFLKATGKPMPKSKEHVKNKLQEQYNSKEIHDKFLANVCNNFCALCLTQKHDNLLMWSHYAGSHSGICVGFNHSVLQKNFELLFPIKYKEEYPTVAISDMGNVDMQQSLFETKHTDWAYECEYRVVNLHPAKTVKFPPELITSVHLGCELSDENQQFITSLLSSRSQPVKMFKANKDIQNIGLNFEEVEY